MSQPLLFLTKHCCNAMKIGFHFVRWPSLTRFTVFLCVQEWFLWTNSLYFGLIFQCLRKLWRHYRPKDWQNFWNCRPCKSIAGLYGSNLWCFYASAFRRRRHHVFGLSVRPSVRLSVRSLKYPLLTCTWVRWSTWPTCLSGEVSKHLPENAWREWPEILHADVSWPSSELTSLWPRSVDFSNFGTILT